MNKTSSPALYFPCNLDRTEIMEIIFVYVNTMVLESSVGANGTVSTPHAFQGLHFRVPLFWSHALNALIEAH